MEDSVGLRFWARVNESEEDTEDDETVQSINTPEFINKAKEVEFSTSQLIQAERNWRLKVLTASRCVKVRYPRRSSSQWFITEPIIGRSEVLFLHLGSHHRRPSDSEGVSKAVDMLFTRRHDCCCLQVLVLVPNIIPQFLDIIIDDYLYELQFRVEENMDDANPEQMGMDYDFGNDDGNNEGGDHENNDGAKDKGLKGQGEKKMQQQNKGVGGVSKQAPVAPKSAPGASTVQHHAPAGNVAKKRLVYVLTMPGLESAGEQPSAQVPEVVKLLEMLAAKA
ncbi:hypothetical protein EJB05_37181, partial [Eragrostis curvula]